jgi:membrane protease YdiL (CAAX protease family)
MTSQTVSSSPAQHTPLQSFLLHIGPGVLTTAAFMALKPALDPLGCPPLLAFLLAILFVDLPVQLEILFREGKKLNGRLSLDSVVLYREKLSWGTFALVFVGAFVVVFLLITLITPINALVAERLFSGLPRSMFLQEQSQYLAHAENVLVLVFTFQLVLTGIVLPWVEEWYFRGYLLPRISRLGSSTPLVGGLFFGLYRVAAI